MLVIRWILIYRNLDRIRRNYAHVNGSRVLLLQRTSDLDRSDFGRLNADPDPGGQKNDQKKYEKVQKCHVLAVLDDLFLRAEGYSYSFGPPSSRPRDTGK
jgi:hypothetical protein